MGEFLIFLDLYIGPILKSLNFFGAWLFKKRGVLILQHLNITTISRRRKRQDIRLRIRLRIGLGNITIDNNNTCIRTDSDNAYKFNF